jgi:ATP-dependent DNA ligase
MEAVSAEALPSGAGWQFEPKWDGFRCLAYRDGSRYALMGKSGKPLTIFFPEIAEALRHFRSKRFVADGELVIPIGEVLSFEALQARLHPAESRRKKLSIETPAILVLFDMLAVGETRLLDQDLADRRKALEQLFSGLSDTSRFRLSPFTRRAATARSWLKSAGRGVLDGVIAKPLNLPYQGGKRAMVKVKNLKTADCVIGGFRLASGSRQVGSLLLGLYNDQGLLDHVGFTSGFAALDRGELTRKLLSLRQAPGFSGNAPGGPSRWSTERSAQWVPVKNVLVVEVRYDHVTDGRFRHGTKFLRWRPDKAPRACTFDQLQPEVRPSKVMSVLQR